MKREVKVIEIECPFCGHKEFSKTKDEIGDDTGFCEGEYENRS